MDADSANCIFKDKYNCDDQPCIQNKGLSRVHSIISASLAYEDDLHIALTQKLSETKDLTINYHKNCVSRYTSKSNTKHGKKSTEVRLPPPKRLRHSFAPFDFFTQCLYCSDNCVLEKDRKHPDRWKPAYLCRSTLSKRGEEMVSYKQNILDKCSERDDQWAQDVRLRIDGAVSDLHAAEARYHQYCMATFFNNRSYPGHKNVAINPSTPGNDTNQNQQALASTIDALSNEKDKLWNSIEVFEMYQCHGGNELSRAQLVSKVSEHFGSEILVLSSPGYAHILAFHTQAARLLKAVKDTGDQEDIKPSVAKVAKQITQECKSIDMTKSHYNLNVDNSTVQEATSETLMDLLAGISPRLKNTMPALLIGNIVTSAVRAQPTDLQVALGVLFRDSKSQLGYLNDYGVTCSYDEVRLFKQSSAVAASRYHESHGIANHQDGLIQVIADNFDTDIHSPNGKLSTHSLAMIVTQPSRNNEIEEDTIPRLSHKHKHNDMDDDDKDESNLASHYVVDKKPAMPDIPLSVHPECPDLTRNEAVSVNRAMDLDYKFITDVIRLPDCPEYNGYNSRICREQGHTEQAKTKVNFLPLIDSPPASPSTMMAAVIKAKAVTEKTGQTFVVFTADQQLYKVAVHLSWENPAIFSNVYLRLGGMHLLMSYVGCIGSLMAESGIVQVLESTFAGVLKMLSGKKYPDNVRALRLLTEELLQPVFTTHSSLTSMDGLMKILGDISKESRTARLWVTCLINPVFTVMKYVRAEREGDWSLHLATVREMVPLFFAAGHFNYARYGLYYLRTMEKLPQEVAYHFLKAEHVIHLKRGIFNGIWSDMAIETTYMRYGKGKSGIVGLTLKPETIKTWAHSLTACNKVIISLDSMRSQTSHTQSSEKHKEESKSRIALDSKDRTSLHEKLETCMNPFDESASPGSGEYS